MAIKKELSVIMKALSIAIETICFKDLFKIFRSAFYALTLLTLSDVLKLPIFKKGLHNNFTTNTLTIKIVIKISDIKVTTKFFL